MGTNYSNVNYSNIQYLVYICNPVNKDTIISMLQEGIIHCNVQGYNNLKNYDTSGRTFYPIVHNTIPNIQNDEFYCWAIFDNKILENRYYHLKNGVKIYTEQNINEFTQEIYNDINLDKESCYNTKVFVESSSQLRIKPYLKYILVMPHKVKEDLRDFHEGQYYWIVRELNSIVNNKYPDAEFRIIYTQEDLKKLEKELFGNNAITTDFIKFNSNTSKFGNLESRHNNISCVIR